MKNRIMAIKKIYSKEIDKWPELERFVLHQIFVLNKNFKKYFKEYNFHKLYRELLNFSSLDLSAFYFDIRKDTLYCDDIKSSHPSFLLVCKNFFCKKIITS